MYRRGLGALATPPANIQTALQSASTQYGVPLPLLQAVAQAESAYNPNAVSSAGAQGLMQIMPANDPTLGVTNPFDPQQSANAAALYLSQLYAQFGNWNDALIAYNQGPTSLMNNGAYSSSSAYASAILANAGILSSTPTADTAQGDSSLFDFSSLLPSSSSGVDLSFTDSNGDLTPVAWMGLGLLALGMVWMAAK